MAQRPGFDLARISTATKILLGAGILLFIDLFLPWQRACVEFAAGLPSTCFSASALSGSGSFLGVLMMIGLIALIVWEILPLANVNLNMNVPHSKVSAGIAGAVVLFGIIKFIMVITNEPGFGSYLGIVLLLAIAYGAYMKFQEPATVAGPGPAAPPPPPPAGGGFST
ncbi:MAG: hypothetical protein LC722_03265 [Actinobacteria bacterium]|nr:hypothetical protein [Actinomycetota bacterium]